MDVKVIIKQPVTKVQVKHIGIQGPPGRDGIGYISNDQNNRLTQGSDNGLYVPELKIDPVAAYILAKS